MNIDYDLKEICYIQGYRTLKNRGEALLGMSPGNSYFKQSTISELIDFSVDIFSKIYIVVPDKPYEHTYRALGYTNLASQNHAQKQARRLKKLIDTSIEKVQLKTEVPIHVFDWHTEIELCSHYQEKEQHIYLLYKANKEFYHDVHEEVKRVIESYPHRKQLSITESILEEGAHYMLKEIAFCIACPEIVQSQDIAIVYHKEWLLWKKFSSGYYNKEVPKIGLIKIS